MPKPSVVQVATNLDTSPTSGQVDCDLPAGIKEDRLLVILLAVNRSAMLLTYNYSATGWTKVEEYSTGQTAVFAKKATGSDASSTVTFSEAAARDADSASFTIYEIKNWGGTVASDVAAGSWANGNSDSPDPASIADPFSGADALFLNLVGYYDDGASVSAYPETGSQANAYTSLGTNLDSGSAGCVTDTDAVSFPYDCGAFTLSESESWHAITIAVKEGISGGAPPMKVNIGDALKQVSQIKVNVGDALKTVTKIKVNVGDSLKQIFGGS